MIYCNCDFDFLFPIFSYASNLKLDCHTPRFYMATRARFLLNDVRLIRSAACLFRTPCRRAPCRLRTIFRTCSFDRATLDTFSASTVAHSASLKRHAARLCVKTSRCLYCLAAGMYSAQLCVSEAF